ncbi:MAG: acid phosphatase [Kutzneria sp.]|nr:acid phosphatase [Kutzneria sp.]MBV9846282.1 acid phosphatase [Kutzneria sp.]
MTTRARFVKTAVVATLAGLVVSGAVAAGSERPSTAAGFGAQPANLGQVKNDVKAYYGDSVDQAGHHHASDDSDWARQTTSALAQGKAFLRMRLAQGVAHPAIVIDVDDTAQLTYGWEADHDFGYNAAAAEQAIQADEFPAIRPTLELASWAAQHGVRIYFLTGRPEHQRTATLKDLADDGYPVPAGAFLKPEGGSPPAYLTCAPTCTTVQFKSLTRGYVESLGNTIVLNLGDQFSDLEGGHAELPVKLPNPMYYLP